MAIVNSYKELIVWQKSVVLVSKIYSLTKRFPSDERFGLVSQLNRASVSIPANIAEGWGRESRKNYVQFLRISRGSLFELETLLIISANEKFIVQGSLKEITTHTDEVSRMLVSMIKKLEDKIDN
jgi:four helix bundle protein